MRNQLRFRQLRRRIGRGVAVVTYTFALASNGVYARASMTAWPCGEHPEALKDAEGKEVWLTSGALNKRVIRRVEPHLPSSLRADGNVALDIILGPTGAVLCARALEGHPILRQAATEAVLGWTFKPYRVKGRTVEVFGHLNMYISTAATLSGRSPR